MTIFDYSKWCSQKKSFHESTRRDKNDEDFLEAKKEEVLGKSESHERYRTGGFNARWRCLASESDNYEAPPISNFKDTVSLESGGITYQMSHSWYELGKDGFRSFFGELSIFVDISVQLAPGGVFHH